MKSGVLESILISENTVKSSNTSAVAAVRYTAGIVDQTVVGLKAMDKKTRKLMTMNGALHLRAGLDRLYVNQKEERRDWMW